MKLEEIDPDVISLVTFTANDIAKTKGWATTLKPDEVKLVLQAVRLLKALQDVKRVHPKDDSSCECVLCRVSKSPHKGKFFYESIVEK